MDEIFIHEEIGGSVLMQYLNSFALVISGFVFYIYIIHFYGSDLVGTVALLLAIVSLLNVSFSLGLGSGMQHYLSFFIGKNEINKIGTLIRDFTFLILLLASAGFIFLYFSSYIFAKLFFHSVKYTLTVKLLGIDLFLAITSGLFGNMLIGLQRFKTQAKWNILGLALTYSLAIILFNAFKDVNFIVIGFVIGNFASTFAYISVIILNYRKLGNNNKEKYPMQPIISYSFPIFLSSLIGTGASYVDRFVVSYLLNLSILGIYNFALLISSALAFIIGPFSTILLPKLSEMYARGEVDKMKYNISKGIEISTLIYVPIALLVASLSSYIILFLSNGGYLGASIPVMMVLIVSSVFISGNILSVGLQSIRKTRIFVITSSVALLSNLILSVLLIPKFQMIGAAIGYSSITVSSFLVLFYYGKKYGVLQFEGIKLAKIYSSGLAMFLIIIFLQRIFAYSISHLFLLIIFGFIIYFGMIKIMKTFKKEDVDFLLMLLPKIFARYQKAIEFLLL